MKRIAIAAVATLAAVSLLLTGCSKGGDPVEMTITHMKAMIKIMKDNKEDCDKIIKELEAYTSKNKDAFEKIAKATKDNPPKPEDAEKMMKKMEPIIKENMAVMMEIGQKCPEKAAAIGNAMNFMK